MPRATPFLIYVWRRTHLRGAFAVLPVKPPSAFRVNPLIQLAIKGTGVVLYPHLERFVNSVHTGDIYAPALIVALFIGARLFPDDWRTLLAPTIGARQKSARTARDVARYNDTNPVVGADELLEMTQLVREFLRPPLDVVTRTAERYDAFVDPATLEVFGRSSTARISDNDAYRIGMLLVMMRASAALGADGWHEFVRYLRWSGVVRLRALARLNKLFLEARIVSKAEVCELLAQFGNSRMRHSHLLGPPPPPTTTTTTTEDSK